MIKKMLVLDLDGTLTNSQKKITPKTKSALMKLQKAGHILVLASGRPTPGVAPIAKELELGKYGGYMLSFNGGRITDCSTGEVIFQKTMSLDLVHEIFGLAEEHNIGMMTYDDSTIVARMHHNIYIDEEQKINHLPVQYIKDIIDYLNFPVVKCLGTCEPERAQKLEKVFAQHFGNRLNVFRSEPFFIEFTPNGIDKAASLQRLCEVTGVDKADMIACGDGFNDCSMIKFAGLGVAMANAQDQVKKIADYITTNNNDEDGIAEVVEKFILSEEIAG